MNSVKKESNQDKTEHISEETNKTEYIYISPDDSPEESVLHRSFDSIGSFDKKRVFLCIYQMKEECYIEGEDKRIQDENYTKIKKNIEIESPKIYNQYYPHLEFLFQEMNENAIMTAFSSNSLKWTFPNFLYEPTRFNEKNVEESQINIEFETECMKYFTELFKNIHDLDSSEIMKIYKGFFYKDENEGENEEKNEGENYIYAFFDMTILLKKSKSIYPDEENKIKYEWAIMDEILYNKKCKNNDFDSNVIDVFRNNPELQTITTTNGNDFPFPFQLYGCKKDENGNFVNIKKKENIQPIDHENFGIVYLFTSDPIDSSSTDTLERFACFIVDAYYNLDDFKADQENKDVDLVKKEINQRFPNTDDILGEPTIEIEKTNEPETSEIINKKQSNDKDHDDTHKEKKEDHREDKHDDNHEDKHDDNHEDKHDDNHEDKHDDDLHKENKENYSNQHADKDNDHDDDNDDDNDDDDDDNDEDEDDDKNKQKRMIKNNILLSSTVYFHEKGRQMWGIKNKLHFTII